MNNSDHDELSEAQDVSEMNDHSSSALATDENSQKKEPPLDGIELGDGSSSDGLSDSAPQMPEAPEGLPPEDEKRSPSEPSEIVPLGQYVHLVRLHAQIRHNFRVLLFTAFGCCPIWVMALILGSFEIQLAAYVAWLTLPVMILAFVIAGPIWTRLRFRPLGKFARTVLWPNLPEGELKNGFIPAVELQEALEKGTPKKMGQMSEALTRAHIHQVAVALSQVDPGARLPKSSTARALKFALASFFLSLAVGIFASERVAQGVKFVLHAPFAAKSEAKPPEILKHACDEVVDVPVVGGVSVTLDPPAYSGRERSISQNTDGAIFGLKGTQVDLVATADRDVARAFMVFEDGPSIPLNVEDGRTLSGRMTLLTEGNYRFRLEPKRDQKTNKVALKGFLSRLFERKQPEVTPDEPTSCGVLGPSIHVALEEDKSPEISMAVVPGGTRVQSDGKIPLRYDATDDFGLGEVALVYQLPSEQTPRRVVLQKPKAGTKSFLGDEVFELAGLPLAASDRLSFYLEAVDNDAMSGPKKAVSQTQTVEIYSSAQRYREVVENLSKLWDRLIHHLADRLESPDGIGSKMPSREQMSQGRAMDAKALKLAEDLMSLVKNRSTAMPQTGGALGEISEGEKASEENPETQVDALIVEEILPEQIRMAVTNAGESLLKHGTKTAHFREILGSTLKVSRDQQQAAHRDFRHALAAEIDATERSIVYLESLLDEARAATLLADAGELKASRRRVADLLENLRTQNGDEGEMKARVMTEMARLKNRMAQLLTQMGDLSRSIQDAHVNEEALREVSEAQKSMDGFSKMESLLNQGDVEGAMHVLDEIGAALETLERKLAQASDEIGNEMDLALGDKLKKFADVLNELTTTQKGELQKTGQFLESEKARRAQVVEDIGTEFVSELMDRAQGALQVLNQIEVMSRHYVEVGVNASRSALENLVLALQVKDFFRSANFAEDASDRLTKLSTELERQRRFFNFGASEETVERQARDVALAKEAQQTVMEIRDALEKISSSVKSPLGEAVRTALSAQSEVQASLAQQAAALTTLMEEINRSAPLFPDRAHGFLEATHRHMSQAQQFLQLGQPSSAFRSQNAATEMLELLQKGMNHGEHAETFEGQAGDSSSSQGERGSGQGQPQGEAQAQVKMSGERAGKGDGSEGTTTQMGEGNFELSKGDKKIPWPWGVTQTFGGFGRGNGNSPSNQSRQSSRTGISDGSEKVQIPQRGGGEASEAFRREVLDGMKGKAPKGYREEVRRYYEQIVK